MDSVLVARAATVADPLVACLATDAGKTGQVRVVAPTGSGHGRVYAAGRVVHVSGR